jgi:hypothetical protein
MSVLGECWLSCDGTTLLVSFPGANNHRYVIIPKKVHDQELVLGRLLALYAYLGK